MGEERAVRRAATGGGTGRHALGPSAEVAGCRVAHCETATTIIRKTMPDIKSQFNRIYAIRPGVFLAISRLWDLNLTNLAVLLNALVQWCTS